MRGLKGRLTWKAPQFCGSTQALRSIPGGVPGLSTRPQTELPRPTARRFFLLSGLPVSWRASPQNGSHLGDTLQLDRH